MSDALKGLTGKLAPARVCFALATLLVVSSLVAFGIISGSAGPNSGGTTTTTPTTTTATS